VSIAIEKKGLPHTLPAFCDGEGPGLEYRSLSRKSLVKGHLRTNSGTFAGTPQLVQRSY